MAAASFWRGEKCFVDVSDSQEPGAGEDQLSVIFCRNRYAGRMAASLFEGRSIYGKRKAFACRWLNPVYISVILSVCDGVFSASPFHGENGEEYASREWINRTDTAARVYYRSHPRIFYLADVYSTVQLKRCSGTGKHIWGIK